MKRIVPYKEVLERLKRGETISWLGGGNPRAYMSNAWDETIRYDTLHKLWRNGLITDYGFPLLHGTIKYIAP